MNVGISNLKQLDGSSAIWDEIKEEYTDNGDTINGKIALNAGTQTGPSLYFITTTGSGLYNPTSNAIGITTNGGDRCHFHNTYIEPFVQIRQIDGTEASPSYSFKNKTDTGLRWNGTNAMGLVVNGGTILQCKSDVTESSFPIRNLDGNSLNPYYSWVNDTDTGIYRQGANDMRVTSGNSDVCSFNSNNFTLYKPLSSAVQTIYVAKKVVSPQQSLTSNTNNIITYDTTAEFSQGSGITYLTSPSSRFRCDVAGKYLFSYNASCTTDTVAGRLYFYFLQKNGAGRYGLNQTNSVANLSHIAVNGAYIFNLVVNDYVELVIYPQNFTCNSPYGTSFPDYHCIYRLC